jgi:hypothetical protein
MSLLRNSRKPSRDPIAELDRECRRLEKKQREYIRSIRNGTLDDDSCPVLPPPAEFSEDPRMRRYNATIPRAQLRSELRFHTASLLLFIVLSISTIAVAILMLRLAHM